MASQERSLELDTQTLWEKYEEIAMHFNDLLMRIRMQSLAGIAALSTIVSIFADEASSNPTINWMVATGLFGAMLLIWTAIFCLDYFYYSRLLGGAVKAIKILEAHTNEGTEIGFINLSTLIEEEVENGGGPDAPDGVKLFYGVVFLFIFIASAICLRMTFIEASASGLTSSESPTQQAPSHALPSPTPSQDGAA